MALNELATLGSFGGGAAGIGYGVKLAADAWRNRHASRRDDARSSVTDAATANASLASSLKETQALLRDERTEARRKDERIDELEVRCEALHAQIVAQRSEYDEQIRALQAKVFEVTRQLDDLRRKLETPPLTP